MSYDLHVMMYRLYVKRSTNVATTRHICRECMHSLKDATWSVGLIFGASPTSVTTSHKLVPQTIDWQ